MHLYSDSTIVLLPDLCNNHKLKQCCSRNNRKIIDSHSTSAVDGGGDRLMSGNSSAETTRVTAMTNATAPQPQPILTASKPNACRVAAANERSLSASPTAVGNAAVLTPPNTPSPVFINERSSSSTNSSTIAKSGKKLLKTIHPHYQQQRAYEQSNIPLNPSPKNQNYSKKPSGKNPASNDLVQDVNANNDDDGEEPIAIERSRRKGSYKKRKKIKKREKHN